MQHRKSYICRMVQYCVSSCGNCSEIDAGTTCHTRYISSFCPAYEQAYGSLGYFFVWRTCRIQCTCNIECTILLILISTARNSSCAKVMFSQVCVCLSAGRAGGYHWYQVLSEGYIWSQVPSGRWPTHVRSVSGRYASYWNAFLFYKVFASVLNLRSQLQTGEC